MGRQFIETLLDVVNGEIKRNTYGFGVGNKLILGGTNAPNGGSGIPWGGLVGTLIQSRIAYDTTEAAVISGGPSNWLASGTLLDNLNHIRHHQLPATWFETSPTYPPSMKVRIASGLWYYGENTYLHYSGGLSPTITVPSGLPRIDLVYVDNGGTLYIKEGTEAANPVVTMPTASGVLPLTAVYVHPSATAIGWSGDYTLYSGHIHKDMRPIITYPPGAASGGGGATYTFGNWLGEYGDHNVRWQPDTIALLRDGAITEYADPDDALDAADTAGDVILVPPGTWTLTAFHALPANTAIIGYGGTRHECVLTCTGDAGDSTLLETAGTIYNISIYYDRQTETNAIALYLNGGCAYSVYAEVTVGNGIATGIDTDSCVLVDCHGKSSGTVLFSYGIVANASSLYHCSGEAEGFAPSVVCGLYCLGVSTVWNCRGTALGSSGTRYGIQAGGNVELIYGRYSGADADIYVPTGTPDIYAVVYDTVSGNVNQLPGDRAGKALDEDITGTWDFDKPLILSEQGTDPSGTADKGKLYTKDDGAGNTELYYVDESGNVNKLTPPSGGVGVTAFLNLTDTPSDYTTYSGYYVSVKGAEDGLEFTLCSGGGGVTTFIGLSDAPSDYTGYGGYVVGVKDTEDGLEFIVCSGSGSDTFTGLSDTPSDYTGEAGKLVAVASGESELEFVTKVSISSDIDHGAVQGLADDDHEQYLLVNGTRAMTGDLDLNGKKLILDIDGDTYFEEESDDVVAFIAGGTKRFTFEGSGIHGRTGILPTLGHPTTAAQKWGDIYLASTKDVHFGSLGLFDFLCQYPDAGYIDDADHFTTATLDSMWDAWTTTPAALVDPDYLGHFLRARPSKEQVDTLCFLTTDTVYNDMMCTLVYSENNNVECGLRVDEGDDDDYIEVYLEATSGAGCLTALWWRHREGGGAVTETQLTDAYPPTLPLAFALRRISDLYWQVFAGYPLAYVTGKSNFAGMVPTRSGLFVRNLSGSGSRGATFHWFTGKST